MNKPPKALGVFAAYRHDAFGNSEMGAMAPRSGAPHSSQQPHQGPQHEINLPQFRAGNMNSLS